MKTYNRAKLLRLVQKNLITATASYRFDDQYGTERTLGQEMAVRLMPEDRATVTEGTVYVHDSYFTGRGGSAREAGTDAQGRQLVVLYVHSNLNFTFAINPVPVLSTHELAERFRRTVPEFQAEIHAMAAEFRMPWLKVYQLWRDYAAQEAMHDQSPLLSEFRETLKLPRPAFKPAQPELAEAQ